MYNNNHFQIIYIVSDPCECFDGSGGSGGSASGSMLRETFPPCPPHTQCKDFNSREVISCSKFLDQLKKFVDEAGSSSVVQLLPNLPSSVKKWESPAREVLGSTEQCSDKYWVIFGSHTVLQHIGG